MGSEAAGLEQASGDVVGQVAEPECGATQVFEPSVERLGRPVAGAGSFEVGEHVSGSLLQGPAQGGELGEHLGDAGAEVGDQLLHELAATLPVLVAIGGDHALVDTPGRLDLDVSVINEQRA